MVLTPITERANKLSENIDTATPWEILDILHACNAEIFEGWRRDSTEGADELLQLNEPIHEGLLDERIAAKAEVVAAELTKLLRSVSGINAVVFSGCGTSGRLGFMAARRLKRIVDGKEGNPSPLLILYSIAGGDEALFRSMEAPEDDSDAGVGVLRKLHADERVEKILFFGISCGFSANYVAGQLDFCLRHADKFFPVALGFNPISMSRKTSSSNSSSATMTVPPTVTFHNVLRQMEEEGNNAAIINPVIGPEPIAGSSRMKGGSATKILLDAIILAAAQRLQQQPQATPTELPKTISRTIGIYSQLLSSIRENDASALPLARLVESAGQTLRRNGRIIYLGSCHACHSAGQMDHSQCREGSQKDNSKNLKNEERDNPRKQRRHFERRKDDIDHGTEIVENNDALEAMKQKDIGGVKQKSIDGAEAEADVGILSLIDASECPPTFGATTEEVRGFLRGNPFEDASTPKFLSTTEFAAKLLTTLTSDDLIVFVGDNPLDPKICAQLEAVSAAQKLNFMRGGLKVAHLRTTRSCEDLGLSIDVLSVPPRPSLLVEASGEHPYALAALLDEIDLKWKLNAISTGAHIIKGKVYKNFMVDVQASNEKLFRRAAGLIRRFSNVEDEATAKRFLLHAIYESEVNQLSEEDFTKDDRVKEHVARASKMARVVPTAIAMANAGVSLNEAKKLLDKEPILKRALEKIQSSPPK